MILRSVKTIIQVNVKNKCYREVKARNRRDGADAGQNSQTWLVWASTVEAWRLLRLAKKIAVNEISTVTPR